MSKYLESREALESRIQELEHSLGELKQRLCDIEEQEQHDAIDNLEEYLQALDHKYDNLRSFWGTLIEEVKQIMSKRSSGN